MQKEVRKSGKESEGEDMASTSSITNITDSDLVSVMAQPNIAIIDVRCDSSLFFCLILLPAFLFAEKKRTNFLGLNNIVLLELEDD